MKAAIRIMTSAVALVLALGVAGTAVAGDIEAGRTKSALCAACHGPTGTSVNPQWPNLAGQHEEYLALSIKAFKEGVRQNVNMNAMVATLSDEDIADIAAFYAAQGCQ